MIWKGRWEHNVGLTSLLRIASIDQNEDNDDNKDENKCVSRENKQIDLPERSFTTLLFLCMIERMTISREMRQTQAPNEYKIFANDDRQPIKKARRTLLANPTEANEH